MAEPAGGRAASLLARFAAWPSWWRRTLAFVMGAVATLALPPAHAVPVLLLAFPVFMVTAGTAHGRAAAFAEGWWFGFGHFLFGLYWIAMAFVVNTDVSVWGGPFAVGLLSGALAVFPGFVALGLHVFARRGLKLSHSRGLVCLALAFAVIWSLAEWVRGFVFTGFPWNVTGTVWAFSPAMMQSAAWWGVQGLGLVTLLAAALPVAVFGAGRWSARLAPVVLSFALVAGLWGVGEARLAGARDGVVPDLRLRVVQANVDQAVKWRDDRLSENFVAHLGLSRSPADPPPTHIIWPETAVPYFLNAEPSRRFLIADVVPAGGVVITGAPKLERDSAGTPVIANSLFAVDGEGRIVAAYDKAHLVPFGEYLPLRGILARFGLGRFVPSALDFTPGPGLVTLDVPGLPPFSPLICYEVIFPGKVVRADQRPDWILNITNDAWYGHTSGPHQHLVAARFRAVEEGLPLVRAAGTGISAVIDAHGRVLKALPLGARGYMDFGLPLKVERPTFFARNGEWSYLCLLGILIVFARWLQSRGEAGSGAE